MLFHVKYNVKAQAREQHNNILFYVKLALAKAKAFYAQISYKTFIFTYCYFILKPGKVINNLINSNFMVWNLSVIYCLKLEVGTFTANYAQVS